MSSLNEKRRILEALGLWQPPEREPEQAEDVVVDFDGGAREPAPIETDPVTDHDALVGEIVRNHGRLGVIRAAARGSCPGPALRTARAVGLAARIGRPQINAPTQGSGASDALGVVSEPHTCACIRSARTRAAA